VGARHGIEALGNKEMLKNPPPRTKSSQDFSKYELQRILEKRTT
jgi:hypothetical protein